MGLGNSWGNRAVFLLYIVKGVSPTPSHGSLWEFPELRGVLKLIKKEEQ